MSIQSTTSTLQVPSGVVSTTTKVVAPTGIHHATQAARRPMTVGDGPGPLHIGFFDEGKTIPVSWEAQITRLERNMNAAYKALLNKPDLVLNVVDDRRKEVQVKASFLVKAALASEVHVFSTPDPYGGPAVGRSPFGKVELYAGTFFGGKLHTPVSDWGQQLEYLHELLHKSEVGEGGPNHAHDFEVALYPVIGKGNYYKQ